MATAAQRQHIVGVIDWLNANAAKLDYPAGDIRTAKDAKDFNLTEQQAHHILAAGGRLQFDCSETDAWILKCAGLWKWTTPGYTGSHLASLPHYTNAKLAKPGALVVFGSGTGHHEAIVHTADPKGGNPLLGSHGSPGYRMIRLHDEAAAQAASGHPGATFLSIAHL